ncbi:MAG TPA: S9 family peptidase [Thermoplasmata archaeon]|nr:S9 family peptidase [Thermoplasmata archaeon]
MTPGPEPDRRGRLAAWFSVATSTLPSVTRDGGSVLFVSDAGELPQAYRVGIDGGRATPVTSDARRVGAVRASPNGPSAVVAVDTAGDEHWQLALVPDATASRPILRALTEAPEVIHSSGRWYDDGRRIAFTSNARDRRFFDVYEMDVSTPQPRPSRIFEADGLHGVLDSAGDRLLIGRARTNLDTELFVQDGERVVSLNPHDGEETVLDAAFCGESVYAGSNPGREFTALVRYRLAGRGHEFVKEYPGDVEIVAPSPDGRTILVGVDRDGWTDLHLVNPSTGEDRPFPTSPRGVVGHVDWVPDGTAFVHDLSSVEGVEIYRRSVETGKPRRLTQSARPVPLRTPDPRLGACVTSDRVVVPYWEYAPPGPALGTIVHVHGGPETEARPRMDRFIQFLVAEGWRVVAPNVRGSRGRGRTFVHLDDVRRRMDSVRDLHDLVGHLAKLGRAERGRVGLVGGSYGGFMVLAALATYPEDFGAGVDIVGISNLVTFLENTGVWRRAVREAEYGRLDTDREFLESISPIHQAHRIVAPLLVIHGRNDPRVPASEAEQIVETLRGLGRSVELMMYEDEGHGISRRANREEAYFRAAEFLARYAATTPGSLPG